MELVQQLRDPDRRKRATPSNELPEEDDDNDNPPPVITKTSTKDILAISEALDHSDGFICGTEDPEVRKAPPPQKSLEETSVFSKIRGTNSKRHFSTIF